MLFRTAGAQDVIDNRNNQYLQGEGYVMYQSYPIEQQPMREGPGNSQLAPVGTSAPYIYQYDRQYNYENLQLNPEYNRPTEPQQERPAPKHKQVSGIFPRSNYKTHDNAREAETASVDYYEEQGADITDFDGRAAVDMAKSRQNYKAADNAREAYTVRRDYNSYTGTFTPTIEPYGSVNYQINNPDNYKTQNNARQSVTTSKLYRSYKGVDITDYSM